MNSAVDLPQIIRKARKAKGLSQADIAAYLGYAHRSHAQRLESGLITIKAEDLLKLAALLDLDLDSLIEQQ